MSANPTERLLDIGIRVLARAQSLFRLPKQDWLPIAFEKLTVDPTLKLSDMLASLSGFPQSTEKREEQLPDRGARSAFTLPTTSQVDYGTARALPSNTADSPATLLSSTLPSLSSVFESMADLNILPANEDHDIKKPQKAPEDNQNTNSVPDREAGEFQTEAPTTGLRMAQGPAQIANLLQTQLFSSGDLPAESPQKPLESAYISSKDHTEANMRVPQEESRQQTLKSQLDRDRIPAKEETRNMNAGGFQTGAPGSSLQTAQEPARTSPEALFQTAKFPQETPENSRISPSNNKEVELRDPQDTSMQQIVKSQPDIDRILEKLAEQLEFELIRTYGTSGR